MATDRTTQKDLGIIYRKLRWVWPLAIVVLAVLYFLSGFYVIKPEEVGVVRRLGRVVASAVRPGIHYRLPWPVDKLDKVKVREVRRMSVGFRFIDRQAGISPIPWEMQFLTGDTNVINIQMIIQYTIVDPAKYLFNVASAHWLVRKVAESAIVKKVGSMRVDDVLTVGKPDIQRSVRNQLQEALDGYGTGLQISQVTLQEVRPPEEVAPAFRDVSSAREDRQRKINEARGYSNEVLPRAEGERRKTIAAAEARKESRTKMAKGDANRFLSRLIEYEKSPEVTGDRNYIEGMEQILSRVKKYIIGQKEGDSSPVKIKLFRKP